jgi:hypothetical protein
MALDADESQSKLDDFPEKIYCWNFDVASLAG